MNFPAAPAGPSAGCRRWELPAEVSGFVGRHDELARLAGLLETARLVTVTGPGGVGKTRLALRAAAGAVRADGCCLVELSSVSEPELLPGAVALRLGLQPADADSRLDALLGELGGRRLLLILDTCEHLADACARFVAAVLRETEDVKVLTTSRQPLHVPGEEVLRLGPLPVTGAGDAVELFAQRAAAAVSGFTLAEEDVPHVVSLCRRLDGIPLAIELAAVRVRALPVPELAARVAAGTSAGTGTRRGSIGRHQTLHAAIEWSHELCSDAEKAAWRRLSVFTGTFDLLVAASVIAGDGVPPERASAVIDGLADKSVVIPADAGRFRLPGSVREYGAARLAEAGEEATCRQRHLDRYLAMAKDFSRRFVADGQRDRLDRLRAEHENIRAALEYGFTDACGRTTAGADVNGCSDAGTAPAGVRAAARLAAALCPYWVMSGSAREGMRWQDKALSRLAVPSRERASALANRALLGAAVGTCGAVAQATEAIAVAASVGDERTHAGAYLAVQFALTATGRHAEAIEAAQQARWRLVALGAMHALRTLDLQLSLTFVLAGNPDAAIEHCRRLLSALGPGERWLRGSAHALAALAYYQQPGQRDECASAAGAALRETLEIGNLIGEACSLEVFAWLAADTGRYKRAAWLLGAAQALWERAGGGLSRSALLAGCHDRSASAAAAGLGFARYTELHAAGGARPLAQIAALAIAGADVLPAPPVPRAVGDELSSDRPGCDGLTSREREIAALVASGLSNREIGGRLVISKRTVDAHVNHIFAKLGLSSRVQLTIWLRERTPARPANEVFPAAHA